MEDKLPTVILRPGDADRLVAGHPWVYEGSVARVTAPAADGDLVQVKDSRNRFIGVGFFNSKSKLRVRLLESERVSVDGKWFHEKIRAALDVRKRRLPKATSFRVVNAESDFLSGLIVDKYEDHLVFQISSVGMENRKEEIISALEEIFSPKAIVERSDVPSRKFEGLEQSKGVVRGETNGIVTANLNGVKIEVDVIQGHKTGYYLDQQLNYELVSKYAKGAQVLDAFCFLGGFTLHAAVAGAAHVHGLDQSAEAIEAAQKNARLNNVAEICSFEGANVFDWLKAQTTPPPNEKIIPKFDLIILDPPSFTRTRDSVPDALRGYKEIHLRALKLLRKGGVLATFCCSHHVDAALYQEVITEAAADARRVLRKIETYTQSPDHPIIPAIKETEYLKGFAFEVAR